MNLRQSVISLQFATLVALTAFVRPAFADGGVVKLREETGPFLVTVFVAPTSPRVGLTDLSVLVQSRDSRETILDGEVDLFFISPPGAKIEGDEIFCTPEGGELRAVGAGNSAVRPIPATRGDAVNKLLYVAKVNLPAEGDWQMRLRIKRGSAIAHLNALLPVAKAGTAFASVWLFLLIPSLLIATFIGHQHLKHQRRQE